MTTDWSPELISSYGRLERQRKAPMSKPKREYVYIAQDCIDARDIQFRGIPESIATCPLCHGNGKSVQHYIEGRMTGPCDFCDANGFIYRGTSRAAPLSVTNQIAVASGVTFRRYETQGIDWRRDPEAAR